MFVRAVEQQSSRTVEKNNTTSLFFRKVFSEFVDFYSEFISLLPDNKIFVIRHVTILPYYCSIALLLYCSTEGMRK